MRRGCSVVLECFEIKNAATLGYFEVNSEGKESHVQGAWDIAFLKVILFSANLPKLGIRPLCLLWSLQQLMKSALNASIVSRITFK